MTSERPGANYVPPAKSAGMARVKGKDTKPELIVRSVLHRMGYRFRLHRRDLPGTPDIVLPKRKKIVLVNGCFWHQHTGCTRASLPKTRQEFWRSKLMGNVVRDLRIRQELEEAGWKVFVIWECETRDKAALFRRICGYMDD